MTRLWLLRHGPVECAEGLCYGASDVQARARISKAGRRVAHVLAEAWQEDEAQPIASLTAHFLIAGYDL